MEDGSQRRPGSVTPREGFVQSVFSGVDDVPVVRHYARALAETVSRGGFDVPWYELSVIGAKNLYTAELTAHLPRLDVMAATADIDVFLAVRDVFESLTRQLSRLRDLERATEPIPGLDVHSD